MGSFVNFKHSGEVQALAGNGGNSLGNLPLSRKSSIYSLTFDELQNNFTGLGRDFGSMNMDELLKGIWTAEETQATDTTVVDGEVSVPSGTLQRQGSLSVPRTLSQKTVDEVWKDLLKESDGALDRNHSSREVNLHQRQRTLGEMTLEEFLSRAGVVREEANAMPSGFYGESSLSNNIDFSIRFQHLGQNAVAPINGLTENNMSVSNKQPSSVAFNSIGIRPYQQQTHAQVLQQHPIFPKQVNLAFATPMHSLHNVARLVSPGTRGRIGVTANKICLNEGNGQRAGGTGMTGFRSAGTKVAVESPVKQIPVGVYTSSLSPSSSGYGQGSGGRKSSSTLDKVVERRHRRMIKNRESAARSRARKQAYTLELEAEIAKLKGINEELQKKQAEIAMMEKNQIQEKMGWKNRQLCLRRTLTGPW